MMGMRQITTKSDLINLYFEVLTADMPFRNLTLRLYARMHQLEDRFTGFGHQLNLTSSQEAQLKHIFFSSVQVIKKLLAKMQENVVYVDRFRPDLWLFENLIGEISTFTPPEDSLKVEFTRLLSHPAMILRLIPETAFDRGARSLPSQL